MSVPSGLGKHASSGHEVGIEPSAAGIGSRRPRFTPFLPPVRGDVAPVVGMASDPAVAHALARCGGGWVNEDGRVLTKGSCVDDEDALRYLPETAAVVAAFDRADEEWKECHESWEANGEDPAPRLHQFLERSGWLQVALFRDDGVKVMNTKGETLDTTAHRAPLATLEGILKCHVTHELVERRVRTYDDEREEAAAVDWDLVAPGYFTKMTHS